MTIIDLAFVHVGGGLLSTPPQPGVNYSSVAYLAWREMSSLVSWLAILMLVVALVVMLVVMGRVVADWCGI